MLDQLLSLTLILVVRSRNSHQVRIFERERILMNLLYIYIVFTLEIRLEFIFL